MIWWHLKGEDEKNRKKLGTNLEGKALVREILKGERAFNNDVCEG